MKRSIGWTCSTHGDMRNMCLDVRFKPEERDYLENVGTIGRITLE